MLEELAENFLNGAVLRQVWGVLLGGAGTSLALALLVLPCGLAAGLAFAVAHAASGRLARAALIAWIDLFRAFPPLVLLIYVYFGLPMLGADVSALGAVLIALTLNASSYFGEIFRAGIESVPRGQWEAGRSTGLGWLATLRRVVLPQGCRAVLPDLVSNLVSVAQLTALASVVSFPELLHAALVAQGTTYNATPLIAAAALYAAALWPLVRLVNRLEARGRGRRARPA